MRLSRAHRRTSRLLAAAIALAFVAATCASPPVCRDVPLTPEANAQLAAAAGRVDFPLQPPCAFRSRLRVERVLVDVLPGDPPPPRVTFVVERSGRRAFLLSQTRALLPFSAIPQGSRRIGFDRAGVTAAGFAGPSGSGQEISYLRWRTDGVTFELSADLGRGQTVTEVERIAGVLMGRGGG